ncbi:putative F-box protein [Cardamine amara subsp. amara]|uniref:F-box protein n=1 Tax=Cardamine amara subsp. amara TaxID=228776 RepID=A0ABD1AYN0_CARAN
MKRVRRNEAMGTQRKRLTSTKNGDESKENNMFSILPMDLTVEILIKCPTKCISKVLFVSKRWSSIIRGKDFTNMYLTRSSTRPRLLFFVYCIYKKMQFLQSCSQEDPSSDHHRVDITRDPNHIYAFSPPVRGLICRQNDDWKS